MMEPSLAIAKSEKPAEPQHLQQNQTNPRAVGDRSHQPQPWLSCENQPGPQPALHLRILGLQSAEDVNKLVTGSEGMPVY